jgi:hypothetical protein
VRSGRLRDIDRKVMELQGQDIKVVKDVLQARGVPIQGCFDKGSLLQVGSRARYGRYQSRIGVCIRNQGLEVVYRTRSSRTCYRPGACPSRDASTRACSSR